MEETDYIASMQKQMMSISMNDSNVEQSQFQYEEKESVQNENDRNQAPRESEAFQYREDHPDNYN